MLRSKYFRKMLFILPVAPSVVCYPNLPISASYQEGAIAVGINQGAADERSVATKLDQGKES